MATGNALGALRGRAAPRDATRPRAIGPRSDRVALVGGLLFALAAAIATLYILGGTPQPDVVFTPDEATNRLSAMQIAETGSPQVELPFADPENLVHIRWWYSDGDVARSAYPPLTYYVYAAGLKVGGPGEWLPLIVSAAGIGALAAAGALLVRERPILGVLLPFIAFPFTFWILRSWMNSGFTNAMLAVALLWFVLWYRRRGQRDLWLATAFIALAGAARPDHLLYYFGALYLAALLVDASQWRRITLTLVVGGIASLSLFALLNWAVVGNPLRAGYQESASHALEAGTRIRDRLPSPLQELVYAIAPWGLTLDPGFWKILARHWLELGPIGLLTIVSLLAYVRLLAPRGFRTPALYWWLALALGGLVVLFTASRYCPGCSVPTIARYHSAAYLMAAVASLVLVGGSQSGRIDRLARAALGCLIVLAAAYLVLQTVIFHRYTDQLTDEAAAIHAAVPANTVVYSWIYDMRIWADPDLHTATYPSAFRILDEDNLEGPPRAVPDDQVDRLASSMLRAHDAGYPVALIEMHPGHVALVDDRLREHGLTLAPLDGFPLSWSLVATDTPPDG